MTQSYAKEKSPARKNLSGENVGEKWKREWKREWKIWLFPCYFVPLQPIMSDFAEEIYKLQELSGADFITAIEVMIFKGNKFFSVNRQLVQSPKYLKLFRKMYEK